MVFVVEDGTGLANSTSYVSVEFAKDYLGCQWTDSNKQKQLLNEASEYADLRWGDSLRGDPSSTTQAKLFPRINLWDSRGNDIVGVPTNWAKAVCHYARHLATGQPLYKSAQSPDAAELKKKKVTVGPVTTEKEWETSATLKSISNYVRLPQADEFARQFSNSAKGFESYLGMVYR